MRPEDSFAIGVGHLRPEDSLVGLTAGLAVARIFLKIYLAWLWIGAPVWCCLSYGNYPGALIAE